MGKTNRVPRCHLGDYLVKKANENSMSTNEVLKYLTEEDRRPYCSKCEDIECKNK